MEALSYYSVMSLILALTWILIFVTKEELRKEMLIISIFSIFLLPIWIATQAVAAGSMQALFSSLSFLDLIFLFSVAGIASTVFHVFFGKHYQNMPKPKRKKERDVIASAWILGTFFGLLLFVWATILLTVAFGLTTSVALLIAAIILAVYITSHRHDLLGDSIWSAIFTAFIVFLASTLGSAFTSTTPVIPFIQTNEFINGVSLDLIYWALALGLVLGPLYEFIRRKLLK
ncbi:hypothetical protein HN358_04320 [Candidatus Uhrbacteria bacterium]|jgi:hypothetical protein|nr:hypothetical protein [Candidatus Uhrbacteria bacterium]MBT7717009.1 hypothetical protein [Candidatus Uhrbacteria bacterium]